MVEADCKNPKKNRGGEDAIFKSRVFSMQDTLPKHETGWHGAGHASQIPLATISAFVPLQFPWASAFSRTLARSLATSMRSGPAVAAGFGGREWRSISGFVLLGAMGAILEGKFVCSSTSSSVKPARRHFASLEDSR